MECINQLRHNFAAIMGINNAGARLAVDPQPQLDFTRLDTVLFFAARQITGLHCHTQAPDALTGSMGKFAHLAQRFTLLCREPGNFMHQRSACNAARLFVVREGNIIRHNHHFDFQAVALGFLCRQAEVQAIAGVVFDDKQATAIAGHRDNRIEHRIHARRGEQVAAYRGG